MGTYTPNLNLYKPDASDDFGSFRAEFNDNMDKLDNGGGGGSGGHTIIDENDAPMTQRTGLQFTGNVSVSDDAVNDKTVVDILGGGGNVYGAFLNPDRIVYSGFTFDSSTHSWTATEDVILTDNMLPPDGSTAYFIRIDGKQVFAGYNTIEDPFVYVKKGQVVEYRAKSGSTMKAYGILQGTNGIFAPVIYSDTERVIGVWRDNKPLYQKTLVANNLNLDTSGTAIDITSLGVEMCTPIFGGSYYIVSGVKRGFAKLEYQEPNEVYLFPAVNRSNTTCYVTIQYTKTADVAGSGNWNTNGVPTVHYSTNEQVIGTYLGKPLYECTISVDNPTKLSASGKYYYDVIYNRSDIEYAQLAFCSVFDSVDSRWFPLPYQRILSSENIDILAQVRADGSFQVTAHFATSAWYNLTKIRYTVQYTKTTD